MDSGDVLLGQILRDNKLLFTFKFDPSLLKSGKNLRLFRAIKSVISSGGEANLSSVYDFDPEIDPSYLSKITSYPMGNSEWHYQRLIDDYSRRKILGVVDFINENIKTDVNKLLSDIESMVEDAYYHRDVSIVPVSEIVPKVVEDIETAYKAKESPGILSGIPLLDDILQGWQQGKYYIVGGRPSSGKSALLLNFALHASENGSNVGIISAESSRKEFVSRALSNEALIDSTRLKNGMLSHKDFSHITDGCSKLYGLPIVINDRSNIDVDDVKVVVRNMCFKHKVNIVFVDYLQELGAEGKKTETDRVMYISRELKKLARISNVPIVVAAQLGRDSDEKKPSMRDLQWASKIEQDADGITLIWHFNINKDKIVYDKSGEEKTYICVEKNRDGRTGNVEVKFDRPHLRFIPIQ